MGSRRFLATLGAALLAGALTIGSGILGAETASPARAASAARVQITVAPLAATPIPTPTPVASPSPLSTSATTTSATPASAAVSQAATPVATSTPASPPATATPVSASPSAGSTPTPASGGVVATTASERQPATTPVSQHSVRGIVVSVQGGRFIVRPISGGQVQVEANPETLITEDRRQVTMAALRPGCTVVAVGSPGLDGTLQAHAMLVSPPKEPGPTRAQPFTPRGRFNGRA